jgi:site-specific recombinase XerD
MGVSSSTRDASVAPLEEALDNRPRLSLAFHGKRHPKDMGAQEVVEFLNHLASQLDVSASTQNQALCAVMFLYEMVLQQEVADLKGLVRAKRPENVPTVLAPEEAKALLAKLVPPVDLIGYLLYGCGLLPCEVHILDAQREALAQP